MKDKINPFITLSELGIDTSGYQINTDTISDALYELYCTSCQHNNKLDLENTEEYEIGDDLENLTSFGKIGIYRWYALTTLYGTDIYKKNPNRNKQNRIHKITMAKGNYELGQILNSAINKSNDLISLLRDPIILNTKDLSNHYEPHLAALQYHLENFMNIPHYDILKNDNGNITFNSNDILQKDVLIPFVIGSQSNIQKFAKLASLICGRNKASCAIGLFITRVKPSLDGKETQLVELEDQIPIISENPFITPIV